jgi:hypothetical protein
METNDLVNEFLLEKFRKDMQRVYRIEVGGYEVPGYDKEKHLVKCETTSIRNVECGWSCGCYSCYTRDDYFEMSAHVGCDCGVEVRFRYGYMYNLPEFIEELDEYKRLSEICEHEDCEEC